jgi:hypothetical protein
MSETTGDLEAIRERLERARQARPVIDAMLGTDPPAGELVGEILSDAAWLLAEVDRLAELNADLIEAELGRGREGEE